MLRRKLVRMCFAAGISLTALAFASAQSDPGNPPVEETQIMETTAQTGYAAVNGINLYYESHGQGGQPLILLHGGLGSVEMFAALIPSLSQARQVIAVDLQAHGRTADIDRPMSFEAMADDIAALIDHLGFGSADLMGFSLGGGVALQTAIRHPEVVRKLILVSTPFQRAGWYPEVLAGMSAMNAEAAQMMLQTPMYQLYSSIAPQPEGWTSLVSKLGQLLSQDYDWSQAVAALTMPVLIITADADSVRMSHAVQMFELLGGNQADGGMSGRPSAQFAVLPDSIHWNILMRADLLLPVVTPFLDAAA